MKNGKFIKLMLLASFFFMMPQTTANPSSTVVIFDLDYVLVDINHWRVLGSIFAYVGKNPSFIWKAVCPGYELNKLFSRVYKIHTSGNGTDTTYNLIDIAHAYPSFQNNFDYWFRYIQSNISPVPDVLETCRKLKDMGYTIVIATNRERIAFELAWDKLGTLGYHNGQFLFDFAVTTKPLGKNFVDMTRYVTKPGRFSSLEPNAAYDNVIIDIPYYKPDKNYYQALKAHIHEHAQKKGMTAEPSLIFFDDARKNIRGAFLSNQITNAFHVPSKKRAQVIKRKLRRIGIVL